MKAVEGSGCVTNALRKYHINSLQEELRHSCMHFF
jgi:hypothetical protein